VARDDVGNYSMQKEFLPRDAMRRRHLCCRLVSVCLSVTLMHSIHTAGAIVKLLYRPGSPIILVFDPQRRYRIPKGTPWDTKYKGVEFCDFRLKSPSISETVRDKPMDAMER